MPVPDACVNTHRHPVPQVSILSIMLFLVAAQIVRSLLDVQMNEAGFTPHVAKQVSALAGIAVNAILMLPVLHKFWPVLRMQFRRPTSWSRLILTSSALGVVLWLGQMLALAATAPLNWPDETGGAVQTMPTYVIACSNPGNLLLTIPVMAIATPVVEEIVHRGIILRALLPSGNMAAIFLSAALFAILHEPATIPYAFVFGVFLALQMIHCGILWATITTHAITNLLVVLSATCLAGQWQPGVITWTARSPVMLIAAPLVICLIVAWALASKTRIGAEPLDSAPT